jgi:hypothetical protein
MAFGDLSGNLTDPLVARATALEGALGPRRPFVERSRASLGANPASLTRARRRTFSVRREISRFRSDLDMLLTRAEERAAPGQPGRGRQRVPRMVDRYTELVFPADISFTAAEAKDTAERFMGTLCENGEAGMFDELVVVWRGAGADGFSPYDTGRGSRPILRVGRVGGRSPIEVVEGVERIDRHLLESYYLDYLRAMCQMREEWLREARHDARMETLIMWIEVSAGVMWHIWGVGLTVSFHYLAAARMFEEARSALCRPSAPAETWFRRHIAGSGILMACEGIERGSLSREFCAGAERAAMVEAARRGAKRLSEAESAERAVFRGAYQEGLPRMVRERDRPSRIVIVEPAARPTVSPTSDDGSPVSRPRAEPRTILSIRGHEVVVHHSPGIEIDGSLIVNVACGVTLDLESVAVELEKLQDAGGLVRFEGGRGMEYRRSVGEWLEDACHAMTRGRRETRTGGHGALKCFCVQGAPDLEVWEIRPSGCGVLGRFYGLGKVIRKVAPGGFHSKRKYRREDFE